MRPPLVAHVTKILCCVDSLMLFHPLGFQWTKIHFVRSVSHTKQRSSICFRHWVNFDINSDVWPRAPPASAAFVFLPETEDVTHDFTVRKTDAPPPLHQPPVRVSEGAGTRLNEERQHRAGLVRKFDLKIFRAQLWFKWRKHPAVVSPCSKQLRKPKIMKIKSFKNFFK